MLSLARFLLIVCVIFSFNTKALAIDPIALVKISSFPCLPLSGPKLQGSGILVRQSATSHDFYVITSEHVVLHGDRDTDGVCHEVGLSEVLFGGKYEKGLRVVPAKLLVADWNSGLALLTLSFTTDLKNTDVIPSIDVPVRDTNAFNTNLRIKGYRFGENVLTEAKGQFGRTLENKSITPSGLPYVVIDETFGDFGMSGGAISTAFGEIVGVLSHKLDPIEQGPVRRRSGQLLGIKWIDVQSWFTRVFAPEFKVIYSRNPWDQIAGRDVIYAFGLRFEAFRAHPDRCINGAQPHPDKATHKSSRFSVAYSGHDPIGIGGHDPIGIGGHDPIGIGGKINSKEADYYIDILVSNDLTYDEIAKQQTSFLNHRLTNLIQRSLQSKDSVWISELDHKQEYCIGSLETFFDKARYSGSN